MDSLNVVKEWEGSSNYLPTDEIHFYPSERISLHTLLGKYGPEGLYAIAKELIAVAVAML